MGDPSEPKPIVARLRRVNGVLGLHEDAEAFDYACSRARADAIDRILMAVFDDRGWSLFDDAALDRVFVEHDGHERARILVDGEAVTVWWQDRVVRTDVDVTWTFEPCSD